jgi:uncharacterized protein (TIGR02186 family)
MGKALSLVLIAFVSCSPLSAVAAEPASPEQVQSDISTREISIQSNFTGIEIVVFGSVDFSHVPAPNEGPYDVIMVIRSPTEAMVARRKERVAGLWVNGAAKTFPSVPGFYAVLSSHSLRAIAPAATLKSLGIGFSDLDFGTSDQGDASDETFRQAVIQLKEQHRLFQEADDGISFIGRSLFRGTVDLPVNVPAGRYIAQVFLFHDGKLVSKNESTLQVNKVGFERLVYLLAFRYPFIYGLVAVVIAVVAGLLGWATFRRE